ncbi:MAG: DUF2062 domain-containing protein [Campylobacterota bacterium]|nr:DUF2062 domain-containing protein [Campylobacterota bacterium]
MKKTSKSDKFKGFLEKYNISSEYLSTSRKMISRAVFIGLFIAFIPVPFQMLLVLAFTPFIRFNVAVALAMCWFSNPFTMPFMYYMEYELGVFILGMEPLAVQMTLDWFSSNLDEIFIPLYVGAAIFSVLGSSLAYYLVHHFWKSSVHRDKGLHFKERHK